MFRRTAAALCSLAAVLALASCGEKNISISEGSTSDAGASVSTDTTTGSESSSEGETEATTEKKLTLIGEVVANFTPPKQGEKVVIITVKDYGDIKIKLFPEYAEKGVENFITLAEQGYYDGIIFHRIINKFVIQGGDPTGTGRGGTSIWGDKFEGGVDAHLIHAAGAVAYANSGATSTNGSQFYIVTGHTYPDPAMYPDGYPEPAKKVYMEDGGTPSLDGGYTVFGQVFDGLDIVFKLQQVETDSNDRPVKDVVIESMKVAEYNGEELKWHITDYS